MKHKEKNNEMDLHLETLYSDLMTKIDRLNFCVESHYNKFYLKLFHEAQKYIEEFEKLHKDYLSALQNISQYIEGEKGK